MLLIRASMRSKTLARTCLKKIPPWIFFRIAELQAILQAQTRASMRSKTLARTCLIFFLLSFPKQLQKVSATNMECNVAKHVAEALECRRKTQQKSICAVRTLQRIFKPIVAISKTMPEISFVCSGRQRRLKTCIGAERA